MVPRRAPPEEQVEQARGNFEREVRGDPKRKRGLSFPDTGNGRLSAVLGGGNSEGNHAFYVFREEG